VLVTALTVVPSSSGVVRAFEERTLLEHLRANCVAVALSGYIFFGSSVTINNKVMEVIHQHIRLLHVCTCVPLGVTCHAKLQC